MFWQNHLNHNSSGQKFKEQMVVVVMVVTILNVITFKKKYMFQFSGFLLLELNASLINATYLALRS